MEPVAIVQARMSSSRLPGKVLADVAGEPVLGLLLSRLARSRECAEVLVATSTEPADEPIAEFARGHGVEVHRGPLRDALARYLGALGDRPGPVVRITGDCPLVDPDVVDAAVRLFHSTPDCAYASNVAPPTFPDGLDVEVVSREALEATAANELESLDREHVTAAVRRQPDRFPAADLRAEEDLSGLRWTVDTPDDLAFLRELLPRLGERRYTAGREEILAAVREPPSLASFRGPRG